MLYMIRRLRLAALAALAAVTIVSGLAVTAAAPAMADPPRWAKAHGHDKHARGHRDRRHVQHHRVERRQHLRDHRRDRRWAPRRHVVRRDVHIHRHTYRGGGGSSVDLGGLNGGHILGGIVGAVVGNQFGKGTGKTVATLGGAVVGVMIGGEIGRSMQAGDRYRAHQALESAPTGRTVAWTNPDTGAGYRVQPTRTYQSGAGTYCRDYTTWVLIDGYEEQARGTACRAPDGSWRPASG